MMNDNAVDNRQQITDFELRVPTEVDAKYIFNTQCVYAGSCWLSQKTLELS